MVRLPLSDAELERGRRLGALLRQARGDRPMLTVALAAGVSPETLRKIESGRVATPAFSTVAAIAGVLELSLDEVWAAMNPARRGRAPAPPAPDWPPDDRRVDPPTVVQDAGAALILGSGGRIASSR